MTVTIRVNGKIIKPEELKSYVVKSEIFNKILRDVNERIKKDTT